MNKDKLNVRNLNKSEDCIFYSEKESMHHLFFKCILAKQLWHFTSTLFKVHIVDDYFSVARFYIASKNMQCLIMFVLLLFGVSRNLDMIFFQWSALAKCSPGMEDDSELGKNVENYLQGPPERRWKLLLRGFADLEQPYVAGEWLTHYRNGPMCRRPAFTLILSTI